jgi:hypothetical protein
MQFPKHDDEAGQQRMHAFDMAIIKMREAVEEIVRLDEGHEPHFIFNGPGRIPHTDPCSGMRYYEGEPDYVITIQLKGREPIDPEASEAIGIGYATRWDTPECKAFLGRK